MLNTICLSKLKIHLKKELNPLIYKHSQSVAKLVLKLAEAHHQYHFDPFKLKLSAYFHDYAKYRVLSQFSSLIYKYKFDVPYLSLEKKIVDNLLHGKLAAHLLKDKFQYNDIHVFNSIYFHSTGRPKMSSYEKLLFISDYCDPLKNYPKSKEIWSLAFENLSKAVFEILCEKLSKLIRLRVFIQEDSIHAYHFYLNELKQVKTTH